MKWTGINAQIHKWGGLRRIDQRGSKNEMLISYNMHIIRIILDFGRRVVETFLQQDPSYLFFK